MNQQSLSLRDMIQMSLIDLLKNQEQNQFYQRQQQQLQLNDIQPINSFPNFFLLPQACQRNYNLECLNSFQSQPFQQVVQPKNQQCVIIDDEDKKDSHSRTQKCFNVKCKNEGNNFTEMVTKKKKETLLFCEHCMKKYRKGHFCDFCNQVYSNQIEDQDDKDWIQCDQCKKWNHLECEAQQRNKNIYNEKDYILYTCMKCNAPAKIKPVLKNKKIQEKHNDNSDVSYPNAIINKSQQLTQTLTKQQKTQSRKDRSVMMTISRENKVQLQIRLNLLEEDVRYDLKLMRQKQQNSNSTIQNSESKKKVKLNQVHLSPMRPKSASDHSDQLNMSIAHQINEPLQQQLGQAAQRKQKQRTTRQKKINFRGMLGEN